ncbi:MAG: papain-like cysteine protease family protein [Deinococcales bacterium]
MSIFWQSRHVFLGLFLLTLLGKTQALTVYYPEYDHYITGLTQVELEMVVDPENKVQEQSNWCWAAVSQMVLAWHGYEVSQSSLVQEIKGRVIDRPASAAEIISVVSNRPTRYGSFTQAGRLAKVLDIIEELDAGNPLIVGFEGHAYVMTAIVYQKDDYQRITPLGVYLRDPWPSNPSLKKMLWLDFLSAEPVIIQVSR